MRVYTGDFKKIYDPSIGEEKSWYINDHTIIKGDDGWHLFGITHEEPQKPLDEKLCAHAFSRDLLSIPLTKLNPPFSANESDGETHFWAPHVIKHGDLYYMYYCAGSLKGHDKYRIHLATSPDLVNWERHQNNPLVVDGFDARDPFVMQIGDRFAMYYTCNLTPTGGNHCVACVTSNDLLHWDNKQIVFTSSISGTFAGPCESPFIVKNGDTYFLFIGPFGGYNVSYCDTAVYASLDPFHFTEDALVGHIPAHASEIIKIGNQHYITHCGWGQGGVYLAPLFFEVD